MADGRVASDRHDWACRRQSIRQQAFHYLYGEKPSKPDVSGTMTRDAIHVSAAVDGKTIRFSAAVKPPEGDGPFPVFIGMGSGFAELPEPFQELLLSKGIAVVIYDLYEIGAERQGPGHGLFYDLYGADHPAGLLTAWAWGVSRLIDVMEIDGAVLDPLAVGVSGCSRFGKAALIAGAFDDRMALTVPNEPGMGGLASLKMAPVIEPEGEPVRNIVQYEPWFSTQNFEPFIDATEKLPLDTHEVAGLIAPRGLVVLDNPYIEHLVPKSGYGAAMATREIYKTLGAEDAFSYLGNVEDGNHCHWKPEFVDPLSRNLDKFLLKMDGVTTGDIDALPEGTVDMGAWIEWETPEL